MGGAIFENPKHGGGGQDFRKKYLNSSFISLSKFILRVTSVYMILAVLEAAFSKKWDPNREGGVSSKKGELHIIWTL